MNWRPAFTFLFPGEKKSASNTVFCCHSVPVGTTQPGGDPSGGLPLQAMCTGGRVSGERHRTLP